MFEMGINSFNIVISKSWYVPQIKDKAISMRNSMLNVQNYQKVFINQNQGNDKQDNHHTLHYIHQRRITIGKIQIHVISL